MYTYEMQYTRPSTVDIPHTLLYTYIHTYIHTHMHTYTRAKCTIRDGRRCITYMYIT